MQALSRRAGARPATTAAAALRRSVVVPPKTQNPSSVVCSACLSLSNRTFSSSPRWDRSHNSLFPPPPAQPPSKGYAALPTRSVISIAGLDAAKFMQGMITRNMNDLTATDQPRAPGFYTGFLQATGRVLYDVFIYTDTVGLGGWASTTGQDGIPADSAPTAFLIECDSARVGALMRHLKKYKLRSKFQSEVLTPEQCTVWQVWDDAAFASHSSGGAEDGDKRIKELLPDQQGKIVLRDPRSPRMGLRVLGRPDSDPHVQAEKSDAQTYQIRRYLDGVAEGAMEILEDTALPLEANMDCMGGIDFRKGCYLGQELTIRTKHRGVVRKRILPVLLYSRNFVASERLEYQPKIPETAVEIAEVGKAPVAPLEHGHLPRGRGQCRTGPLPPAGDDRRPAARRAGGQGPFDPFDPTKQFLVQWGGDNEEDNTKVQKLGVKAFVPEWLSEDQ
ncbi:folate-binding protein [Apiospora phragmitis]|uniref:Iron-sulfur cluster assembly factor IBA57 homolog, mitochondrial n=1 Tax=Apiospora phragmitis TaxID=2905665 RepID=A0ABR1W381_9PEZI